MKKIKNKFIIIVISTLLIILGVFFMNNKPSNLDSQAILRSGGANILRESKTINLEPKIPFIINQGDSISTIGTGSLLIIKWGDGSVTRLGGNSNILIDESIVSHDLSHINISFELIAGKTWSNVTSFFGEKSYFHQTFQDNEAAVRGTTFNVDLEKDYLYVTSHAVELTNNKGDKVTIGENKPFSIQKFDFISLLEYINKYKDASWKKINSELDKIQLEELRGIIANKIKETGEYLELEELSNKINNIKDINVIDEIQKNEIYDELLVQYQKIHFADSQSPDLLTLKLDIKEAMLNFASVENKKELISSTIYDVKEVKKTNDPLQFQTIINIFSEHKDILDDLDIYFPDIINIENLSEDFNAVLNQEIDKMSSLVSAENIEIIKNLKVSDFDLDLSNKTQKFLDNNLPKEEIKGFLQKLIHWFNSLNK